MNIYDFSKESMIFCGVGGKLYIFLNDNGGEVEQ